jgi:prepilin-type N-terminal cleavage/methylation domain-containing protein
MRIGFRQASGFTLIEILVVVLIASIVMAILVSVLGSSFEILRAGETKAQQMNEARSALDYMCNDIESAAYIPLSKDRDLNGWRDEVPEPYGYYQPGTSGEEGPVWRVAWRDSNNIPVVAASYFLTEAWSDRAMFSHNGSQFGEAAGLISPSFANAKDLISGGQSDYAEFTSFFRLALPVAPLDPLAGNPAAMPYYLQPPYRVFTGSVPMGRIYGYPDVVSAGPHKETATLMQDMFLYFRNSDQMRRSGRIPIASNITRIKFEYMQEVPVYTSRVNGNNVEIAYQNLTDGTINWRNSSADETDVNDDEVPILANWELRQIDVAYDGTSVYTDPGTSSINVPTSWRLADQYPEGYDTHKLDGSTSGADLGTGVGLGERSGSGAPSLSNGWNCSAFWDTDSNSDGFSDNAPIDRFAYVTNSISGNVAVTGGIAQLRPDMKMHGNDYVNYAADPTGIGDMGDADGIPDGDGIPDDPVPGWWMPYLRAVRVSVVATPKQIIQKRLDASGKPGKSGTVVYYRLDSPVPYSDPERTLPLTNQKQDYLGSGRDLLLTKTVPVSYTDKLNLLWDPRAKEIDNGNLRRVDLNVLYPLSRLASDPLGPGQAILSRTPWEKLFERENMQP